MTSLQETNSTPTPSDDDEKTSVVMLPISLSIGEFVVELARLQVLHDYRGTELRLDMSTKSLPVYRSGSTNQMQCREWLLREIQHRGQILSEQELKVVADYELDMSYDSFVAYHLGKAQGAWSLFFQQDSLGRSLMTEATERTLHGIVIEVNNALRPINR